MKWLNDPPSDWESAADEPPSGRTEHVPLRAELLVNGVVVREPGSTDAYIYAREGAVEVDDKT